MTPGREPAIGQLEDEVRRLLAGSAYNDTHPEAARSLAEAFDLLWSGKTDHNVATRIGDALSNALVQAIDSLLGPAPPGEDRPLLRLRDYLTTLGLPLREAKVAGAVVELARVALRHDHRLSTIHAEVQQGEPDLEWDELRRAAFATAYACYELGQLQSRANGGP